MNSILFLLPCCYFQHCGMHILFPGNYIKNGTRKQIKKTLTHKCSIWIKEIFNKDNLFISHRCIMLETNYWVSIPMLSCSIPQIINPCTCTSKLCCIYYSGNEAFGINFFCHHTINRRHLFNKLCFINCSWNAIKTKQYKGYLFNEQTINIIFKKKYIYKSIIFACK